jgi:selenocysteine lyase/cysteine desulfurase
VPVPAWIPGSQAVHGEPITINSREGCVHMGVHFYNTREEIDRVLKALESWGDQSCER